MKVAFTQNFTPGLSNLHALFQRGWGTNMVHAISLREENLTSNTKQCDLNFFDKQPSFTEPHCQYDTPQVSHGRMPRECWIIY